MFGGGFFGGGMPDMGGMGRRPKGDNERYYKLLGVERTATETELKKAFRKASMKHHPDKGGDAEKFKEINEAYDALKDPEKRRIYDQYGEEALKEGGGGSSGASSMADIFDMMSGGMGGGGRRREQKGEPIVHKLRTGLDEMYKGSTRRLALTRKVKCPACKGVGTKSGRSYVCTTCNGSGVQIHIRQIGPGMIQQVQAKCSACNGVGEMVPPDDKCPECNGAKVKHEKKIFTVQIEPGMKHHQKIVIKGEAGYQKEQLDMAPGDLIFILEQKKSAPSGAPHFQSQGRGSPHDQGDQPHRGPLRLQVRHRSARRAQARDGLGARAGDQAGQLEVHQRRGDARARESVPEGQPLRPVQRELPGVAQPCGLREARVPAAIDGGDGG